MNKLFWLAILTAFQMIPVSGQTFFTLNEEGWSQRLIRRTTVTSSTGIANPGGASATQDYDGNTYYLDQACGIYKVIPAGSEKLFASGLQGTITYCSGLTFTPGRKSFLILADIDPARTDRAIIEIYPSSLNPPPPPAPGAPFGFVDFPDNNASFTSQDIVVISGWALASAGVGHVDIIGLKLAGFGAGKYEWKLGSATLDISRPDVLDAFPSFNNPNAGWSFSIPASVLLSELNWSADTPLTIIIRVYDAQGLRAELKRLTIIVTAVAAPD